MKIRRMKKPLCLLLAAVLMSALLPTPVFAADAEKKSVSGFYMDTIITLTAYTDDEAVLNDAMKECGCVYLAATGGTAVTLADELRCTGVEWEDLGMAEAMWLFESNNFGPLVVAIDAKGNSIYDEVSKNLKR